MTRGSASGVERRSRLREIPRVRQEPDSPRRRWFTCVSADLYLWQDDTGITAFEFCYGKPADEHVLRWSREAGALHARIDDGESHALESRSPLLVGDGLWSPPEVALAFEGVGATLEPATYRLVLKVLYGE